MRQSGEGPAFHGRITKQGRGHAPSPQGDVPDARSGSAGARHTPGTREVGRHRRHADGSAAADGEALPLEDFLSGLRIAWRGGEVKPDRPPQAGGSSESGADPILSLLSLPSLRNGSRQSLGERHESCLNACRSNIPACIPTVQRRMRSGAVRTPMRWCSGHSPMPRGRKL
ncbi:hypothetical protein [Mesorhizobium sp. LSJC280B00]|uniref:hypothetical protein n=1 Tax=Mesorhizobium sp. LSJC280B00 TaxID=1287336 RepID=UPI000A02E9BA|nr:hypothetical protein [Mesorhizobium sp. LSJC280B00]